MNAPPQLKSNIKLLVSPNRSHTYFTGLSTETRLKRRRSMTSMSREILLYVLSGNGTTSPSKS
jgi:hypothetical protein